MAGQPKAPFYAVVALVVAGLVAFAVYRADILLPQGQTQPADRQDRSCQDLGQNAESPERRRTGHDGQGI